MRDPRMYYCEYTGEKFRGRTLSGVEILIDVLSAGLTFFTWNGSHVTSSINDHCLLLRWSPDVKSNIVISESHVPIDWKCVEREQRI